MKRLYVLIDKSLDPVYGCVQGGHCVAQYLIENGNEKWNNDYLIYLYADLDYWMWKLKKLDIKFSIFREPDLQNKITSISVLNNGELFKNLKLVS